MAHRIIRNLKWWWMSQPYMKRSDEGTWLITPPAWMRHIMPWRLLNWIMTHTDVCNTNVVMWKMYGAEKSWWPNKLCFHPHDYCGKFEGKRLPECAQSILITFMGEE